MRISKKKMAMGMVLVAVLLPVWLGALPTKSSGEIEFWVDGAAFAGKDGRTWQEIYWSFSPLQLGVRDSADQRLVGFRTEIKLWDSTGTLRAQESWNSVSTMPDSILAERRGIRQLDQITFPDLRPGRYKLAMAIHDLISGRQGQLETELLVPGYEPQKVGLSQIELASEISADTTPSRFRKGALQISPRPERRFSEVTGDQLFYYAEIYDPQGQASYVRVAYNSAQDPTFRIVEQETLSGARGSRIKYGGLSLKDLEAGFYRLHVQLLGARDKVLAASQANFIIERKALEVLPQQRKILEEQTALERQGGEFYNKIELIATQKELAEYGRLGPEARKEFLRQFWKKRDPNPNTPENEALEEHVKRYRYAEAMFREQNKPGSETDRGRMYIKYGPPDEIEKRILESGSNDVLIWRYNNGQELIFSDRLGVGRFELVYDKQNPGRSDPNYLRLLQRYQGQTSE